jgi:hypothetical protein
MDKIMLGEDTVPEAVTAAKAASSKRPFLEDENENFLAWKQGILQRAVEAGFVQYQQFLPTPDTA